jgi:DNA-binding transcriptional ArsR family regulator
LQILIDSNKGQEVVSLNMSLENGDGDTRDGGNGNTRGDGGASDEGDEAYVSPDHVLLGSLGDHPKLKILAVFIGHPEMDFNVTELAEYAGLKRDTVYKYLDSLRGWGFVETTRQVGNSQMYQLDTDSEPAEALAKLEWTLLEHLSEKEQAGELDADNEAIPEN